MAVTFKRWQRALIVKMDGELDAESAKITRRRIDVELDETGARDLIFDMSKVTFMDSSGIGMMIGRYKRVNAVGGRVKIFGASRGVRRIIELSGLGQIVTVYESEKAAVGGETK